MPTDGLKKRVLFVDSKIDLEAVKGEFRSILVDGTARSVEIEAADPSGLVEAAEIVVKGLEKGEFRITHGASSKTESVTGDLKLIVPVRDAGKIKIERMSKKP